MVSGVVIVFRFQDTVNLTKWKKKKNCQASFDLRVR